MPGEGSDIAGSSPGCYRGAMECARCNREMTSLVRGEVPFAQCPSCGGMWFEVNALDRVCDGGLAGLPIVADLPVEPPPRPPCPECRTPLHDLLTLGEPRLHVGACKVCHGRWLDAQEFEAHRGRGVWGRIRRVFGAT